MHVDTRFAFIIATSYPKYTNRSGNDIGWFVCVSVYDDLGRTNVLHAPRLARLKRRRVFLRFSRPDPSNLNS
jgi:hypothetical protein